MNGSTPQASWSIGPQQQATQPDAAGRFTQGILVHFTTGKGNQGTVFVPEAQYNPTNVAAQVQAKANAMDAVSALSA